MPVGGLVRVDLQQQLCPFDLMTRLEAPWFEQVVRLVDVVFPVMGPVGRIMFPYLSVRGGGEVDGEFSGNAVGAIMS